MIEFRWMRLRNGKTDHALAASSLTDSAVCGIGPIWGEQWEISGSQAHCQRCVKSLKRFERPEDDKTIDFDELTGGMWEIWVHKKDFSMFSLDYDNGKLFLNFDCVDGAYRHELDDTTINEIVDTLIQYQAWKRRND